MKFREDLLIERWEKLEVASNKCKRPFRERADRKLTDCFRQRYLCSECTTNQTMVLRLLSQPKKVFAEDDSDTEEREMEDEQYAREKHIVRRYVLEREFAPLCKSCAQFAIAADMDHRMQKKGSLAHWKMLKGREYSVSQRPKPFKQRISGFALRVASMLDAACNLAFLAQVLFGFALVKPKSSRLFLMLPYIGLALQTLSLAATVCQRSSSAYDLAFALLRMAVAVLYYAGYLALGTRFAPLNLTLPLVLLLFALIGGVKRSWTSKVGAAWNKFLRERRSLSSFAYSDRFSNSVEKNSWMDARLSDLQTYHASTPLGLEFYYYLNSQRPRVHAKKTFYERSDDKMDLDDDQGGGNADQENDDLCVKMYVASRRANSVLKDDLYSQLIQNMQPVSVSKQPVLVDNLFPFKSPHSEPSNNVLLEHMLSAYQTLYTVNAENTQNVVFGLSLTVASSIAASVYLFYVECTAASVGCGPLLLYLGVAPALLTFNFFRYRALSKSLFMLEKLLGSLAALHEETYYLKLSDPYYAWVLVTNRWFQRFRLRQYFRLLIALCALGWLSILVPNLLYLFNDDFLLAIGRAYAPYHALQLCYALVCLKAVWFLTFFARTNDAEFLAT